MSSRSSNVSMNDDAIGSDSFCNNTPAVRLPFEQTADARFQMSPAVSETGEEEESNLSKSRSFGFWDLASPMGDTGKTGRFPLKRIDGKVFRLLRDRQATEGGRLGDRLHE